MTGAQELVVVGPDRFCEVCGRLLVHVHEDGTFDLAGAADVQLAVEYGGDALVAEATCHLRRCRLRRWLRAPIKGRS